MGITRSTLPRNNGNLPLPFFCGNYPIVLLNNIYSRLYMYINWFTWIIFIHDCICYTKIGGNENYPDSLNVMVNYHYHRENRVITRQFPYMTWSNIN